MKVREKTFRNWFVKHMDADTKRCIREYGCAMTAPAGLIWYSDTTYLYQRFKDEIWEIIKSAELRITQVKGCDEYGPTEFENALVWCAAEVLAFECAR
jgi:hypothetical protein